MSLHANVRPHADIFDLTSSLGLETISNAYAGNTYGKRLTQHIGTLLKIMRFSMVSFLENGHYFLVRESLLLVQEY